MTLKNDSSLSLTLQLLIFATFLVVGVSESSHPKKPMVSRLVRRYGFYCQMRFSSSVSTLSATTVASVND